MSGGQLLKIRLLNNQLVDNQLVGTFDRKSTARHKIYQLVESSKSWLNRIQANDKKV